MNVKIIILLAVLAQCTDLFEWFRSQGGYIHPALELSTGPDPSWTVRGVFATERIEEGLTLIDTPQQLQICGDFCDVVQKLHEENTLGEESIWWPFLEVLKQHDVESIPLFWEKDEQAWLEGAGPSLNWDFDTNFCGFEPNEYSTWLVGVVSARVASVNDKTCLVPVYDMTNHRNGDTWNTSPHVTPEESVQLISFGSIEKGQQIFNSFGHSTPSLFWQYGFVEQLAQSWNFFVEGEQLQFATNGDQVLWGKYIDRAWVEGEDIPEADLPQLKDRLQLYLQQLIATTPNLADRPETPRGQKRFDLALAYREAWRQALDLALASPMHDEL